MKTMEWMLLEEEATRGPKTKKKLKKILFSIRGLASSSHHFSNIDQLDHIQILLPIPSEELALACLETMESVYLTI